jgi:hypothetical protein
MEEKHAVSIWFFIGIELVIYGLLIFGAGVYQLFVPPANPVVLFKLHAGVWWGAILLLGGTIYCVKFWPRKGG